MKLIFLPLLFIFASCSSTMVQSVNDRPKFAPKNYQQVGIVKYLNNGADYVIGKRREHAFKQMYEACGGPDYKVTFEGTAQQGRSWNPNSFGGFTEMSSSYMFIEFLCDNKTASN